MLYVCIPLEQNLSYSFKGIIKSHPVNSHVA